MIYALQGTTLHLGALLLLQSSFEIKTCIKFISVWIHKVDMVRSRKIAICSIHFPFLGVRQTFSTVNDLLSKFTRDKKMA